MTATLNDVANKKVQEPSAEARAAVELVRRAKEQGLALTGPDGLLKQLTKTVLETALNEEMTGHLGYDKHDPAGDGSGNVGNGTRSKTVLAEATGQVEIDAPPRPGGHVRTTDRAQAATPSGRRRRGRALPLRQGSDDRGNLRAFRRDLRRLGVQGDHLQDHRQGPGGDARLVSAAAGTQIPDSTERVILAEATPAFASTARRCRSRTPTVSSRRRN